MHEPTADDEYDLYSARTEAITVVDGMEIDIEVRQLRGGDEDRCEKVLMDLKDRLGLVAQAFEDETPPSEITNRDPDKRPIMTVAWDRLFSEEEEGPVTDGGATFEQRLEQVNGVGPVKAQRVASEFDTLDELLTIANKAKSSYTPPRIVNIDGFSNDSALTFCEAVAEEFSEVDDE